MKNKKGFTLIEIMIAIAIIGILALVLVPRVATMRNQAKLAGIDTNLRIAQGVIENIVSNYDPAEADQAMMGNIEAEIKNRLGSTDPTKAIKNPITSGMGVLEIGAIESNSCAFAYSETNQPTAGELTDPSDTLTGGAGTIVFDAYWLTTPGYSIGVRLVPYDDSGKVMTGKIKKIVQ